MPVIQFGTQTITYTLVQMARKTLAISVHPDLSVLVKAPETSSPAEIEQRVQQRAAWILKQQRQFEIYLPDVPARQYVSGESHRFLGRQYRLKVLAPVEGETADGVPSGNIPAGTILLTRQFLEVYTADKAPARVRELVTAWYQAQASQVFQERLALCFRKFEREQIGYPKISIRRMQSSWGSCSAKGVISLNIKLIQVPRDYIDYVLTHELCHLKQLNHSTEFYTLLGRVLPDWEQRKDRLDRFDFG